MGIHVGGIHVAAKAGIDQLAIAEFIRAHWVALGARLCERDPLVFRPLALDRTGDLGFAVTPAAADADGRVWIGIYDSERYRADPVLAQELAEHFATDVWSFEISDSVDEAHGILYGAETREVHQYSEVIERVERLPFGGLYFNQLQGAPKEQRAGFVLLAFESVPHREGASYSGPSQERQATNLSIAQAQRFVADRDAGSLLALAGNQDLYREVIAGAIEGARPDSAADLAFVYQVGPLTIDKGRSFCSVAEAALRMEDEAMFEAALAAIPGYSRYRLELRARELATQAPYVAFRFLEALSQRDDASLAVLNNVVYQLLLALEQVSLPAERIDAVLERAGRVAPQNPAIFHNLACVHVRRGQLDQALECVAGAVRYGYPQLDKLRDDPDLDPIRGDPRFAAAFEPPSGPPTLEHLWLERSYHGESVGWLAPTIGLHLYFGAGEVGPGAAAILDALQQEFPQLVAHYLPRNAIRLAPTPKGQVRRTINQLRQRATDVYFNGRPQGGATELRFLLSSRVPPGELSVHLPIALATDPDALVERLVSYAQRLPFRVGNAGYSIAACYESNGAPALSDPFRVLDAHLGAPPRRRLLTTGPTPAR
jgi:hypothetical protein